MQQTDYVGSSETCARAATAPLRGQKEHWHRHAYIYVKS